MPNEFRHPLLRLADGREAQPPPQEDITPPDFRRQLKTTTKQKLKLAAGRLIYPIKSRRERSGVEARLALAGVPHELSSRPDLLTWGDRGFGNEIFLKTVASRIGEIETVACLGCGMGGELFDVARFLRPKKIIAYDYLNYGQAWEYVREQLARRGVEVCFVQCDLRNPIKGERVDALLSFAVLEHLHSIPDSLAHMKGLLRPGGWFIATWGPLWYTYSGDHIAGELGFEHGYDHVLLIPDKYIKWHAAHPRNSQVVSRGEPTWLDMGLVSFAQYREYIREIECRFGRILWLGWAVSTEGYRWRQAYPDQWHKMLEENQHLGPLDLLLKSVSVIVRED